VAATLDATFNSDVPLVGGFTALLTLPDALLPATLSQLSGEIATAAPAAGFRATDLFLSMMLDPFASGRNIGAGAAPALAFAAVAGRRTHDAFAAYLPAKAPVADFASRWSAWGGAYGGWERRDGDAQIGSNDVSARAGGFAAGADHRWHDGVGGVAVSVGETAFSLANGLGSGRTEFAQVGAYGSLRHGPAYVSGALAYAWHRASTDRTVALAGGDPIRGAFDAQNFGLRVETGWRVMTPVVAVTPYAALVAQSFRMAGYAETAAAGAAAFALAYGGRTTDSVRSELGAWIDRSDRFGRSAVLTLRGRAAWVHDYSDEPSIAAGFPALPGTGIVVTGASYARDAALLSAASELAFANGVFVSAKFDGEFSGQTQSYSGTAAVRRVW
jgi:outer membrane autotransporter protein